MSWSSYGKKPNKYGAKKYTSIDGIKFDSKKEGLRWEELKLMEKAGAIRNLRRQVAFEVVPKQMLSKETWRKNSKGERKLTSIEKPVKYVADFVYEDSYGRTIAEDTKGVATPEYIIKRKLMKWIHKLEIHEI